MATAIMADVGLPAGVASQDVASPGMDLPAAASLVDMVSPVVDSTAEADFMEAAASTVVEAGSMAEVVDMEAVATGKRG
jgi:hypothetical protein